MLQRHNIQIRFSIISKKKNDKKTFEYVITNCQSAIP